MTVGAGAHFFTSLHDGYQIDKFSSNKQAMVNALAYDKELDKLFAYCQPKEYSKSHLGKLSKENNLMGNIWDLRMAFATGSEVMTYWDTINSIPVYREIINNIKRKTGSDLTKYLDNLPKDVKPLGYAYWITTLVKGTKSLKKLMNKIVLVHDTYATWKSSHPELVKTHELLNKLRSLQSQVPIWCNTF